MANEMPAKEQKRSSVREAVGLVSSPEALESAVNQLELAGFDAAMISVLARDKKTMERLGQVYESVPELEDAPKAPQGSYITKGARGEGAAAIVGIPLYIGGVIGAFAVVASGGVLAAVIGATVAGGAAGAGLGALLARAIGQRYSGHISEQIAQGGIVLWVRVHNRDEEEKALDVLAKAGAFDVHAHEIEHEWLEKDVPIPQPDPFLTTDPS